MMTVFHKLNDDRGIRCKKICTIRSATKQSGYAKGFLVHEEETGRFWSAFFILGSVFAIFVHFFFWIRMPSGSRSFFSPLSIGLFIFAFVGYGGCMGIFIKLYAWRSPKHARQAMLRAALCPSCGYSIAEIIPDPDGCAVCPECGAAWRFDG